MAPIKKVIGKDYEVVVIGGGMSGVCVAIASARHGARTALIQNRPVLGGNASSEIRMHICGADASGRRPDGRETGILEELCLENKKRNPTHCFSIWDAILWEKTQYQERLDLYLNTHFTNVDMEYDKIIKVHVDQLTTEKKFVISGKIFIDATGDGTLGYLSGADYMIGREGKNVFGEMYAPDKSDHYTMGSTLMFKAVDAGEPMPFEKPVWADTYTEKELCYRDHTEITSGYWWIELGGGDLSTIDDAEKIRDELLKAVYGVWDHIKNGGDHGADNYVLDWVQFLPGKRESRRLRGDYVLIEPDVLAGRIFDDAVTYGGWPMDMHNLDGLRKTGEHPTVFYRFDDVYTIPYRCLYSRNVKNLMLAGRAISVSHMAFGSSRDMGTTSVVGQAVGTASAMMIEKNLLPRELSTHIKELQQKLLKDDCYIPGYKNEDNADLARSANISCSSYTHGNQCENVINGIARRTKNASNCWVSEPISKDGEWIKLEFGRRVALKEILLFMDSNLSKPITVTLSERKMSTEYKRLPHELIKHFMLEFLLDGVCVDYKEVRDNHFRYVKITPGTNVTCDSVKLTAFSTHGDAHARIFEIRAY